MKTPSFLKEAPQPGAGVRVKDEAACGPGAAGILYSDEHRATFDNPKRRVLSLIASAISLTSEV
ncbi:MAG: hypothetical protein JKY56_19045 [Kofleriaceae bacterium]|nr:hypothetical protein [Kofleriaceae bacterium]